MFLLRWIREWHEIRNEYPKEKPPCESCETLKMQLSIANENNANLMNRLLTQPNINIPTTEVEMKPIMPRTLPWKVRQQMLEAEDRHKAILLKQQSESPVSTAELEKEMDTAAKHRESMGVQDAVK